MEWVNKMTQDDGRYEEEVVDVGKGRVVHTKTKQQARARAIARGGVVGPAVALEV